MHLGADDGEPPAVLLDELGAAVIVTQPLGETAFLLELGGNVNRPPSSGDAAGPPERARRRYLVSVRQAAELMVAIGLAAGTTGVAGELRDELERLRGQPIEEAPSEDG